ncbi:MAG: hypothetical protein R2698_03250 [Microthrixaceae bacterium]
MVAAGIASAVLAVVGWRVWGTSSSPLGDAIAEAKDARSFTMRSTATFTPAALSPPFTAAGTVDVDAKLLDLTMDMSTLQPGGRASGTFRVVIQASDPMAMYLPVDSVAVAPTNTIPPGKKWVRYSIDQLGTSGAVLVGAASGGGNPLEWAGSADPSRAEHLGRFVVDGVTVDRYRLAIPARDLVERSPGLNVEIGTRDDQEIPFEFDVDGNHHLRRMSYSITAAGITIRFDIHLSRINRPVHIRVPPAGEVIGFDELTGNR